METINNTKERKWPDLGLVFFAIIVTAGLCSVFKDTSQPKLQAGYWYSVEDDEVIAYPKADFRMETLAQEIKRRWSELSQDDADEIAAYLKSDSFDAAIYAGDECIQRNQAIIDTLNNENQ